jgi:hypothetical protein
MHIYAPAGERAPGECARTEMQEPDIQNQYEGQDKRQQERRQNQRRNNSHWKQAPAPRFPQIPTLHKRIKHIHGISLKALDAITFPERHVKQEDLIRVNRNLQAVFPHLPTDTSISPDAALQEKFTVTVVITGKGVPFTNFGVYFHRPTAVIAAFSSRG